MSKKAVENAAKLYPALKSAWEEYGHAIAWTDLYDAKIGSHGYAALAWKEKDGTIDYADLASPDGGETWEMQNDGHETVTEKQWKAARVKPQCDWLINPDGSHL